MLKIINTTPDYDLAVGISIEPGNEHLCYQIINRVYNVVEAETQLLPQGFEYLEQLQAALDQRRDDENAISDQSNIVTLHN